MTTEHKKIYNQFVKFVESGLEKSKFTKALYLHLSLHMGFIAHFNQEGFYASRFSNGTAAGETFRRIMELRKSPWSFKDENTSGNGALNLAIVEYVEANQEKLFDAARAARIQELRALRDTIDAELRSLEA